MNKKVKEFKNKVYIRKIIRNQAKKILGKNKIRDFWKGYKYENKKK